MRDVLPTDICTDPCKWMVIQDPGTAVRKRIVRVLGDVWGFASAAIRIDLVNRLLGCLEDEEEGVVGEFELIQD